jgi:hypothetical protein
MKSQLKLTTILLIAAGVLDLAAIPVAVNANHHQNDAVPPAAIILIGLVAVVTLASVFGIARGMRWAFIGALVGRALDTVSSVLGAASHPDLFLGINGVLEVILSVAAIVLLARQFPRRAAVAGTPR